MAFAGKKHSGHTALHGEQIVLRIWRNGSISGDGNEQEVAIDDDLWVAVKQAMQRGLELFPVPIDSKPADLVTFEKAN